MNRILLLMAILFCLSATSIYAAADDVRIMELPQSDREQMQVVWSKLGTDGSALMVEFKTHSNFKTHDSRLFKYDTITGTLIFNHSNFLAATDKSRKTALKSFMEELHKSKVSESTQQSITNTLRRTSTDLSAALDPIVTDSDETYIYLALRILSPYLDVIRLILGIAAIIIVLFLVMRTVLDLVYLGLPFARELMEVRSQQNGKFRFVSSTAVNSMKESETSIGSANYKNVYVLYFRRIVLRYIILSICLGYLALDGIGQIIKWLLNTYFY
ncbi:hypothetical protein [Paenibacillus piri]|uniref:DUF2207 domain-containing protein n=1 Tax=Paenibacillus piri TaxID=2547395 RepID=A0A4R5L070_9BACL|nr:hypothetical protein [Paenibacillus piri]TDG00886.1 hypothetical protein E1757_04550 [Paenibacillus piri]